MQLNYIIVLFQVNVFLEGFEKLAEKFFKSSAEFLAKHVEKKLSLLRILRSIPTSLKDKIKSLPNTIIGNFPEPFVSIMRNLVSLTFFFSKRLFDLQTFVITDHVFV